VQALRRYDQCNDNGRHSDTEQNPARVCEIDDGNGASGRQRKHQPNGA
jgi:hypothetical protein